MESDPSSETPFLPFLMPFLMLSGDRRIEGRESFYHLIDPRLHTLVRPPWPRRSPHIALPPKIAVAQ